MSDISTLTLFDPPPGPVQVQLTEALAAVDHLDPADRALSALALRLAAGIDHCDDKLLSGLSGQLLATLDRLGMSPRARRHLELGRGATAQGVNPLDELALIRTSRRAAGHDAGP